MSTSNSKEVYYFIYCSTCKHAHVHPDEDPCNDCLDQPLNENSHRPVRYDPDDKAKTGVSQFSRENAYIKTRKRTILGQNCNNCLCKEDI